MKQASAFDVLYYPLINPPVGSWFNAAALYFDTVGIIVPENFDANEKYIEPRTRRLIESKLIKPVSAASHYRWSTACDDKFFRFVETTNGLLEAIHRDKAQRVYERFHSGKLTYSGVFQGCLQRGWVSSQSDEWYQVPKSLAAFLSTYIAAIMASNGGMNMITDFPQDYSATERDGLHSFRANVADERIYVRGMILEKVLNVPVNADPLLLKDIREKYSDLFTSFRRHIEGVLDEVLDRHVSDDMDGELSARIREIEDRKVEIAKRIEEGGIWDVSRYNLTMASIPIGAALIETTPTSIFTAFATVLATAFEEGQRIHKGWYAKQDPLAFAVLAEGKLRKPQFRT